MEIKNVTGIYGVVRKTDSVSRISMPREYIEILSLKPDDEVCCIARSYKDVGSGILCFKTNGAFDPETNGTWSLRILDAIGRITLPAILRTYYNWGSFQNKAVEMLLVNTPDFGPGVFIRKPVPINLEI